MLYNKLNLRNFEQTSEWTNDKIEDAIFSNTLNKKLNDETMLMYSIKAGDDSLAKRLIDLGASLNIGDSQNRTPLWLCSIYNRDNIAKYLLENGADMEEKEGHNSPLYNAIKFDNNEVAEVLIDMGANVNLENRDSQTPLHCAVFRDNYDMVECLLKHGANKNIKNNIKPLPGEILFEEPKRQSPYDLAIEYGDEDLIELFEKNYDIDLNNNSNIKFSKTNQDKNPIVLDKDKKSFVTYLFNNYKIEDYKNEIDSINDDYDFEELEEALDDSEKSGYKNGYDIMDNFSKGETFNYKNIFSDLKDKFYNIKQKINQLYSKKTSLINENKDLKEKETNIINHINYLNRQEDERNDDLESIEVSGFDGFSGMYFIIYAILYLSNFIFYFLANLQENLDKNLFLVLILDFVYLFIIIGYFTTFKDFTIFPFSFYFKGHKEYSIHDEIKSRKDMRPEKFELYLKIEYIFSFPIFIWLFTCIIGRYCESDILRSCIIGTIIYAIFNFLFYICYIVRFKEKMLKIFKSKIEAEIEKVSNKIAKSNKQLKDINKEEDNEKIKINNIKIEEIDKEIEELKYQINLNEIKNIYSVINKEIYKKYNVEQEIVIKRWNEFSNFRKLKYNRLVEENLKKSNIFSKLNSLVDKKNELIDTCYNTKNCEGNGGISDYVNYIYDKIDKIDEKL